MKQAQIKNIFSFLWAILLVINMVGLVNASLIDTILFTENGIINDPNKGNNLTFVGYYEYTGNRIESFFDYLSSNHINNFTGYYDDIGGAFFIDLCIDRRRYCVLEQTWVYTETEDRRNEYPILWGEGVTFDIGGVKTDTIYNQMAGAFLQDELYSISELDLREASYVNDSSLTVNKRPVLKPVSMILFGFGLIGLVGFGRNRFWRR